MAVPDTMAADIDDQLRSMVEALLLIIFQTCLFDQVYEFMITVVYYTPTLSDGKFDAEKC